MMWWDDEIVRYLKVLAMFWIAQSNYAILTHYPDDIPNHLHASFIIHARLPKRLTRFQEQVTWTNLDYIMYTFIADGLHQEKFDFIQIPYYKRLSVPHPGLRGAHPPGDLARGWARWCDPLASGAGWSDWCHIVRCGWEGRLMNQ